MSTRSLFACGATAVAVLCLLLSCAERPESGTTPPLASGARTTEGVTRWWPMHRGDPSLRGLAQGTLPPALQLAWTFQTQGAVVAPAVISEGKVYVGSQDGNLYCLDLARGTLRWSFGVEGEIEAAALVLDGTVFVGTTDGHLYAVREGKQLWRFSAEDKIASGPSWAPAPGGTKRFILAGSHDNNVYCLEAGTGKVVWSYESGYYINGTPAVWRDCAVVGGCDAIIHIIGLRDGKRKGGVDSGAYIGASVAVAGDRAYSGNFEGWFFCVDLEKACSVAFSGESRGGSSRSVSQDRAILWRARCSRDPLFSSPAVGPEEAVVGCDNGTVFCLNLSDGSQRWAFRAGEGVRSSPIIVGDAVVVGSDDGLVYVLERRTGKKTWSYEIGEPVKAAPSFAAQTLVVGAEDGWIYAFQPQRTPEKGGAEKGHTR